jgi:hypothetical protein
MRTRGGPPAVPDIDRVLHEYAYGSSLTDICARLSGAAIAREATQQEDS